MNANSLPHQKRHTQGATLIVVVILTMLTLLAILFITMNLSMGMRRTTEDQRQTLPAQFAAEAGVATAQAQLGIFQNLSNSPVANTSDHNQANNLNPTELAARKFPLTEQRGITMTGEQLLTQVRQLCGGTALFDADPRALPDHKYTINGNKTVDIKGGLPTERLANGNGYGLVCHYPEGYEFETANLELMRNVFVVDREGGRLDTFYKDQRMDEKTRNTFLEGIFGTTVEGQMANNASYKVQSGIKPIALFRAKREVVNATKQDTNATTSTLPVNVDRYGLLFSLKDIDSTGLRKIGDGTSSERRQVMRSDNKDTLYFLEFSPVTLGGRTNLNTQEPPSESFSVFARFVHDAQKGAPLGHDTIIDGRMHTNSSWTFRTNNVTTGRGFTVNGLLTSAGCVGATFNEQNGRCTNGQKNALIHVHEVVQNNRYVGVNTDVNNPTDRGTQNNTLFWGDNNRQVRVGQGREPGTNKLLPPQKPNLVAPPIKLPVDSLTQQADAKSGGISIPTSVNFLDINSVPMNGTDPKTGAKLEMQEFAWTPGTRETTPSNPTCTLRVVPVISDNGERTEEIHVLDKGKWVQAVRKNSAQCGFEARPANATEKEPVATYNGNFHVNGAINGLYSTSRNHSVANGMSTTITAENDINIMNSITYSDYIAGSERRDTTKNNGGAALGLYSAQKAVQLTNKSQSDINIDAFIITPKSAFQHRDYNKGQGFVQGKLKHYGGQTMWEGGNGVATVDRRAGYIDRTYSFDSRGISPRGFPSFKQQLGNQTNTEVNLGTETVVSWSVALYPPEGTADGNPLENISFANFGELRQEGAR